MDWVYQGDLFGKDGVGRMVGFVYTITNLKTGRQYIGKKVFHFTRKVRGRRTKIDSDWRDYFGSNEDLLGDVKILRGGELQEGDSSSLFNQERNVLLGGEDAVRV